MKDLRVKNIRRFLDKYSRIDRLNSEMQYESLNEAQKNKCNALAIYYFNLPVNKRPSAIEIIAEVLGTVSSKAILSAQNARLNKLRRQLIYALK